jgi:hypothetical protein
MAQTSDPPHACPDMAFCLRREDIPVAYDPSFREYFIVIRTAEEGGGVSLQQSLLWCPWCGASLPASLRDQLYDELEGLKGAEIDNFFEELESAPERFKDDRWWYGRYGWEGEAL